MPSRARPSGGIGAGGYEDYWAQNATLAVFVRNPHSLPLQGAAELGAVGSLLLLGFACVVVLAGGAQAPRRGRGARRGRARRVARRWGRGAVIDWTWEIPAAFAPAIVAAGLLTASRPGRPLGRTPTGSGPGRWRSLGSR